MIEIVLKEKARNEQNEKQEHKKLNTKKRLKKKKKVDNHQVAKHGFV